MSDGLWFRLNGNFAEHPKVMDLSDRAFRLHVAALCHATRNLTDGFLSELAVKVACALAKATRRHVVELRDAGLWIGVDGGWEIKDYVVYQAGAVRAFAEAAGGRLQHVKPHGALYTTIVPNPPSVGPSSW